MGKNINLCCHGFEGHSPCESVITLAYFSIGGNSEAYWEKVWTESTRVQIRALPFPSPVLMRNPGPSLSLRPSSISQMRDWRLNEDVMPPGLWLAHGMCSFFFPWEMHVLAWWVKPAISSEQLNANPLGLDSKCSNSSGLQGTWEDFTWGLNNEEEETF